MQIIGGIVFILGVFFWCGNVFGFFHTFPLCGYIVMVIGGAIWKKGKGE